MVILSLVFREPVASIDCVRRPGAAVSKHMGLHPGRAQIVFDAR
jgi:hypothetical protein